MFPSIFSWASLGDWVFYINNFSSGPDVFDITTIFLYVFNKIIFLFLFHRHSLPREFVP